LEIKAIWDRHIQKRVRNLQKSTKSIMEWGPQKVVKDWLRYLTTSRAKCYLNLEGRCKSKVWTSSQNLRFLSEKTVNADLFQKDFLFFGIQFNCSRVNRKNERLIDR
jgi:hypothetical protein